MANVLARDALFKRPLCEALNNIKEYSLTFSLINLQKVPPSVPKHKKIVKGELCLLDHSGQKSFFQNYIKFKQYGSNRGWPQIALQFAVFFHSLWSNLCRRSTYGRPLIDATKRSGIIKNGRG